MRPPSPGTIFRPSVLAQLGAPEQIDQPMRVTTPKGWLALCGLAALLVLGMVWGLFGSLPVTVRGQGVLTRVGGLTSVVSLTSGRVQSLATEPGANVQPGEIVATVLEGNRTDGGPSPVITPSGGRVVALQAVEGDFVERGAPLLTLEATDKPLEMVLYVPLETGKVLRPGMDVQIAPTVMGTQANGFLRGAIRAVGGFPATSASMKRTLGSDELVRTFSAIGGGAPVEVHVALVTDPGSRSGYAWSSGSGPPDDTLDSGTPCSATVIVGTRSPFAPGQ